MSQDRVEIWVDHLEAITKAARAYDEFTKTVNKTIPGNDSDLEFYPGPIDIRIAGEDTGWHIDRWDDATWFYIGDPPTLTPPF